MAKLKLWGHVRSLNVQKVLWALSELGLEYERIDAGGSFGKVRRPHVRGLLVQLVRTPEDERDRAVISAAQQSAQAALTFLDRELGKQPHVAGPHFTWGDIPVGAAVQRWQNLPLARPSYSALNAWYERLKTRPASSSSWTSPSPDPE